MARGARKVAPARPERQASHPKLADRPRQLSAWSSAAAVIGGMLLERQHAFALRLFVGRRPKTLGRQVRASATKNRYSPLLSCSGLASERQIVVAIQVRRVIRMLLRRIIFRIL